MEKHILSNSAPSFYLSLSLNRIVPRFKSAVQSGLKTRPSPGSNGEIAGENVVVFSLQSSSCRIFGSNIGVSSGIMVATGIMAAPGVLERNTQKYLVSQPRSEHTDDTPAHTRFSRSRVCCVYLQNERHRSSEASLCINR